MTALHQYISAIGSFQGVLLFFLLACDRDTTAASKILGLTCLSMGLAFFLPFITYGVAAEVFNPLAAWLFFLPVMYGPLLYLYCSKVVFNAQFVATDLWHTAPLFACYALNLDTLFIQHEALRLWIVGAQVPTSRLWFSEYILFAVAMAYLVATAFLIKRYHRQASDTLSNFNPDIFRWLGMLISFFIVIFSAKGVMAFSNFATLTMVVLSDLLIVLVILLIALTQWKNPHFFAIGSSDGDERVLTNNSMSHEAKDIRINNIGTQNLGTQRLGAQSIRVGRTGNDNSGALDKKTRASMFDELVKHIEQEKSYRNSELSLSKLADSTGLSPHHLSEVLNQHAGENFNHFINSYRVKEVCERLNSSSSSKVLDIAIQAGFSSKSTFNTIFKKFMGVTPTQYRQRSQT